MIDNDDIIEQLSTMLVTALPLVPKGTVMVHPDDYVAVKTVIDELRKHHEQRCASSIDWLLSG